LSTLRNRASLETDVFDALIRMIAGAILFNHQVAERMGLGPSDGQFLTLLQLHGALTPGRLASLSGLTTGTVSGVLDRLESAGYVRRDRATDDRRKVIVSRNEERIDRDLTTLYGSRRESLLELLRQYDDSQLAIISDFMRRLAAS
jgi:DNA-binding MarR family transcriptional regulator